MKLNIINLLKNAIITSLQPKDKIKTKTKDPLIYTENGIIYFDDSNEK